MIWLLLVSFSHASGLFHYNESSIFFPLKKYFHAKDWFLEINWRYRHFVFIDAARLLQEREAAEMKVCFSRSRSSFSSTFLHTHTHSQSFKTLISFPTLIQKNKPGGNEFWAQKSSTILHYWLTFRMESGKLISFSIQALIGLLIGFRKIWIVNKCYYFVLYWQWIKNLAIWLVFVISMYVLVSHHSFIIFR